MTDLLGRRVSYGDYANDRRSGTIVAVADAPANIYSLSAGMKPVGRRCTVVFDDYALTEMFEHSPDTPGGWRWEPEQRRRQNGCCAALLRVAHRRQARELVKRQTEREQRDAAEAAFEAELAARKPAWAKAVIVAELEVDTCDPMIDHFSTKTTKRLILAWSKHDRNNFAELRKAAAHAPETTHFVTAPTVNRNGEPKTDVNKDWWHPADEHRENYSMGHGYYLKAGTRYSSGWTVRKERLGRHLGTAEWRMA